MVKLCQKTYGTVWHEIVKQADRRRIMWFERRGLAGGDLIHYKKSCSPFLHSRSLVNETEIWWTEVEPCILQTWYFYKSLLGYCSEPKTLFSNKWFKWIKRVKRCIMSQSFYFKQMRIFHEFSVHVCLKKRHVCS